MSSTSNVAHLRTSLPAVDPAVSLGPADVIAVGGPLSVTVRREGGAVHEARLALAVAYAPVCGDVVLVIGTGEGHYVIGVLSAQGKVTLAIPGDVEVRAVGGRLRLSGDEGVMVEGREVELRASALRVVAGTLSQKLQTLRQRVTELWSVHAGEQQTIVDGPLVQQSKSATIVSDESVTINGQTIHLG